MTTATQPAPAAGEQSAPQPNLSLPSLTFRRILGARLYLHTWIRLFVAFFIVVGAVFAKYVVGITDLSVPQFLILAIVIAGYNAGAWFIARSYRAPERSEAFYRFLSNIMYGTIVLDYLALTIAIWMVGGSRSPFLAFYLLHVMLSCILLSRRAALFSLSLAYALLAGLVIAEWQQLIPIHTPLGAIPQGVEISGKFALTILVVYGTLFGLTAFFLIGLADLLRRGDRELRQVNLRLNRLSKMRRDFLHIALHDLKTPVAAVEGLMGNLRDELCGPLNEKQEEWVKRSLSRLEGLTGFLQDLQTLASLETGDLMSHADVIVVPDLLREIVAEHLGLAESHQHTLRMDLQYDDDQAVLVRGVPRLIREAVINFVTNAIKYTPDGGEVVLRCMRRAQVIRIEVQDSGIGIAPEDQERAFDQFVRLRQHTLGKTAEGTGLGLAIVRRIIRAHGGTTGVTSEQGIGSTFSIELPACLEYPADAPTVQSPRT